MYLYNKRDAIHKVCDDGDLELLKFILKWSFIEDKHLTIGRLSFSKALTKNHLDVVNFLLTQEDENGNKLN